MDTHPQQKNSLNGIKISINWKRKNKRNYNFRKIKEHKKYFYSYVLFHLYDVALFMISALHKETNVGSLLLLPTTTTIPYPLFKIVPCATV